MIEVKKEKKGKLVEDGKNSYYYTSGMYEKDCLNYKGKKLPKWELPNWLK